MAKQAVQRKSVPKQPAAKRRKGRRLTWYRRTQGRYYARVAEHRIQVWVDRTADKQWEARIVRLVGNNYRIEHTTDPYASAAAAKLAGEAELSRINR